MPSKGWTKILVLAGFSTTIGGSLAVGYNIGVVNAPAVVRVFQILVFVIFSLF